MFVPYFRKDRPFNIYQRINAIFLLKAIWKADYFFLFVVGTFFLVNFIFHILIAGKNNILYLFQTFDVIFSKELDWSNWKKIHNIFYLIFVIVFLVYRTFLSFRFLEKIQLFKEFNSDCSFFYRKGLKFMAFVPFISFSIYPIMSRLSKFEVVGKYNL